MSTLRVVAWIVLAFNVAIGGGGLALQRQETDVLRAELALWRGSDRGVEGARAENLRLRNEQVSPAELAALRADQALAEQRRKRIEELQRQIRAGKR